MAFVYKSDNDRSIILSNQSDLGPGEYLDKNKIVEYKQHPEPFLSSINGTLKIKNETPGPGAYYQDIQEINTKKNLIKSEYSKNIDSIRAQVTKDRINLKKLEIFGFDSKVKRFVNDKNKDTPGPGQYFPSILNKTIKNNFKKIKIDDKNKFFIKLKSKLTREKVGLPSTFAIQSNNQILRKTFQYDNFGCRPKIFNIRKYKEFIELNNSSFASTNYSDNKKLMKSLYHNSSIKESNSMDYNKEVKNDIKKVYKNNSMNKNLLNCRINFCKKINEKKRKNKTGLEKLIEKGSPGPGYYFDSINDIGIRPAKPKSESYQFFGTKTNRFYNLNKSWTKLGPGEYFTSKENEEDDDVIHIPFGSNKKRDNSFIGLETKKMNPGPGEYEIDSFTNNAEFDIITNCNKQFGTSGERFNDKYIMKDKYNSPGPGHYNPKYDFIKPLFNDNKKLNKKNIFMKIHNKYNKYNNSNYVIEKNKLENLGNPFLNGINFSVEEFKGKEKIPPVGYYYPEFFNTIDYKNKKKILESNQDGVCFNRTIPHKIKKSSSTSELLGPGYYNNADNNKAVYYQIKPAFHSSSERGLIPKKKEKYNMNLNDFREYYMKEYFNWNKKSFNMNFI